ncbi:AAA family ATPase [Acidianus manzaensis]|uniref:ATPase n=1 Tax=Acidianus manzaensis TaxID=282676 RepID=A0A1W6JZ93_9CREN|nr:ATP-binding protein [Acidianus manzaensis]ARM75578.1 ATPase [Acidianus manzaensis]
MLFDERPKTKREDLFDRENELNGLLTNIYRPLIVLSGVRRIGKTSLLLVALNESKLPFILIDARKLKDNYGWKDIYELFSQALSSSLDKIADIIRNIRGVSILGTSVELSWKGKNYVSLADLFDHLNQKRIIIAIDEAQRLRGPLSREVKEAIAHAYDYDRNLTFILTGSEVGLLYDLIGIENDKSPLYGRYFYEIKLDRFSKEKGIEFLKKGFEENKKEANESTIEEIINFFDGIPGWLTLAGNYIISGKSIEEVKEISIRIAVNEISNLIESKRNVSEIVAKRYKNTLKCISEGNNSWTKLYDCLSKRENSTLSSSTLSNILQQLENMSIIYNYDFLDPVYKEAVKRL